jgi:hypothetical protein
VEERDTTVALHRPFKCSSPIVTHARSRVAALVAAHGVQKSWLVPWTPTPNVVAPPASQGQPSLPPENQPPPAVPKQLAPSHPTPAPPAHPAHTFDTSNPCPVKCPASFSLFFFLSPSNFILDHISSALSGPSHSLQLPFCPFILTSNSNLL